MRATVGSEARWGGKACVVAPAQPLQLTRPLKPASSLARALARQPPSLRGRAPPLL